MNRSRGWVVLDWTVFGGGCLAMAWAMTLPVSDPSAVVGVRFECVPAFPIAGEPLLLRFNPGTTLTLDWHPDAPPTVVTFPANGECEVDVPEKASSLIVFYGEADLFASVVRSPAIEGGGARTR
jgi:hypothetical protein